MAAVFVLLASLLQAGAVSAAMVPANEIPLHRSIADKYYKRGDYKKAYSKYLKLARSGDAESQYKIATMTANGQGRNTNLTEAYAWSVLAAERGHEKAAETSKKLLQQVENKEKAQRKAAKLRKKYGKLALEKQEEKNRGREDNGRRRCTGWRLGC